MAEDSIVQEIVKKIQKLDAQDSKIDNYKIILISCSVLLIIIYYYRYLSISKNIPQGYSEDFKSLTILIITLCGWNAILTLISNDMVLNLKHFLKLVNSISNPRIENEVNEFLSGIPNVFSIRNWYVFGKDLRIASFAIISMIFFNLFANSISKAIEYIAFIKSSSFYHHSPNDTSGKKVSFDNTLTTFSYLDNDLCVTKKVKPILQNFVHIDSFKIMKKSIMITLTFILFISILPEKLYLNSTSFLYSSNQLIIKFDHVYYTLITFYIYEVFHKFIKVANHPNFKNFPYLTSMASHFTWGYCSLILSSSIGFILLSGDVLTNVLGLMAQTMISYSSHPNIQSSDTVPRHFVTSIIINYLQHSIGPAINSINDTNLDDSMTSLTNTFIWVKSIFTNCWIVTNFTCFLLLPIFIWIVIIEFKIGYNKSAHF
ncbi:hypothetical protein HYPBUDRAFT_109059 [Hyphopichia burtonii NRRL Y-1933]|uniref:Uncharacterized protein n=1 Tax=Hyphopichia burtonii NRRL Y-1933 TaxID=984485 RepID=A0A1E4RIN9_9ASCO|nr:hypothetical protein HYPBUDRAFT_109059 [Hyphopichia burtonii NRRL Y-1933]ODV66965.1 hypothetical protein HYPBUDRAFT_109059 [Hyphopichia burtonii NRRL Y-1933]